MRIFEQIRNGLRTKLECLKVILSWQVEHLLGVPSLFKILGNLLDFNNKNRFCKEKF